uniref:Phospholipid/glycerol acyltransferase domain-containing protein n=1 Tax=Trypanosoma congolense (strain IL3000) TaxID=1068625 RepID=G0UVZ5_TRYCI|nr:conserved hypothetical protein [Trypanosoma congolense IL3000]
MFCTDGGCGISTALESTVDHNIVQAYRVDSTVDSCVFPASVPGETLIIEPTFRRPRPALPREPKSPFHYDIGATGGLLRQLKGMFVIGAFLPLRVVFACFLLVLTYLLSVVHCRSNRCKSTKKESENLQEARFSQRLLSALYSWTPLTLGYWFVSRKGVSNYGRRGDGTYSVAPIIVANHVTLQDGLLLLSGHNASLHTGSHAEACFTSMIFNGQLDISCCRSASGSLKVKRGKKYNTPLDVAPTAKQGYEVSYNGMSEVEPCVVFPEACCTNGTAMIRFAPTAFSEGVAVQPVVVRHRYKYFNPSWCSAENPWIFLLRTMSQLYNRVEITYLPVYEPSEEEKRNPSLFAENVRRLMANALEIPVTDHSQLDVQLAVVAQRLKLPAGAVNVETSHPHFSSMTYDRIARMLHRFSSLLDCKKPGGPQAQGVPNGFMSLVTLGEFFSPLGSYPTLRERLGWHISRRAAVRGPYVAFRDLLSTLYTEPITIKYKGSCEVTDSEQCSDTTPVVRVAYMDEMQEGNVADEMALNYMLRRTFAMMLLVGEELLRQRDSYRSNSDKGASVTTLRSQGSDGEANNSEGPDGPRCGNISSKSMKPDSSLHTTVYGFDVRFLFRPSQGAGRSAPVAASLAATAETVEDRRLGRSEFDALLDILFVPHPSIMWRGSSAKSQTQLLEEDSFFDYIRSGGVQDPTFVGTREPEKTGREINRTMEFITLHGFLRFSRRHRTLVEYFHACCERFLLCDDLS